MRVCSISKVVVVTVRVLRLSEILRNMEKRF